MSELDDLKTLLTRFRDDRNWKQFHTLKNLIISLNLESAELLELTQWKSDADFEALKSDTNFQKSLQEECADIFLYLLLVSENAGFDLTAAAKDKLLQNAIRYPINQSFGTAKKYTQFDTDERLKAKQNKMPS